MELPLVSVIMPVLNGEKYISTAIQSVLYQDYLNWELLIVDDFSTDDTLNIIQNYSIVDSRIRQIQKHNAKTGAAASRNLGILASSSKYIIFLDADDVLLPHCISQRVKKMEENSEYLFGVFLQKVNSNDIYLNNKVFNKLNVTRIDLLIELIRFNIPFQTSGPIWRREYLIELDGFDTSFKRMEDPDLHVRAILNTSKFSLFYDMPYDCLYTLNNISIEKYKSISILTCHDVPIYLKKRISEFREYLNLNISIKDFYKNLEFGFFHISKYYFVSNIRISFYDYSLSKNLLLEHKILSLKSRIYLRIFELIFLSESKLIITFRLRGVFYKLIFN